MNQPATPTRILSVGEDHLLLNTRELVLRQAGYEVHSLFGREIMPALLTYDFYFLLLCHTVPPEAAREIYRFVRSHGSRPIVVRLRNSCTDLDRNFDVICDVWRGPASLLEELIRIRRHRSIKKSLLPITLRFSFL